MLPRDDAKRIRDIVSLGVGEPNLVTFILLPIESGKRDLLAVQISIDGISENRGDVFLLCFASSDVRTVNDEVRTRRNAVSTDVDSQRALVSGIEPTSIRFA